MKLSQIIIEDIDYSGVPDDIRVRLEKYPSHFQEWGVREIKTGQQATSVIDAIDYYIEKISDNRFQKIMSDFTNHPKNILSISLDQLKTVQAQFDERFSKPSKRGLKKLYKKNYATVLVDNSQLRIIKVEIPPDDSPGGPSTDDKNNAAGIATDLARGTMWCVTNPSTAIEYLIKGPLYYITLYGKRYLLHIETKQFMNTIDHECFLGRDVFDMLSKYIKNWSYQDIAWWITFGQLPSIYGGQLIYLRENWPNVSELDERIRYTIINTGNVENIFNYTVNFVDGRWEEGEEAIIEKLDRQSELLRKSSNSTQRYRKELRNIIFAGLDNAIDYARYIVRGRWREIEKYIFKSLKDFDCTFVIKYCKKVIPGENGKPPGRWSEIEPHIINSDNMLTFENIMSQLENNHLPAAMRYAEDVILGRWPEYELNLANRLKTESDLESTRHLMFYYCKHIANGRVEIFEQYITDSQLAYDYTCEIINFGAGINDNDLLVYKSAAKRWPQAEKIILNDDSAVGAYYTLKYAENIINNRWPEAESKLMKWPTHAAKYAMSILQRRWPEAEYYMNNTDDLSVNKFIIAQYKRKFGIQ